MKLSWNTRHQKLPTNYQLCVKRLKGLKRRLDKDPEIAQEYNEVIQEQSPEKVTEDEQNEKILFTTSLCRQKNCGNDQTENCF